MLFACYIRRHYMTFMVRSILLFDICCSLHVILRLRYKRYWYVTSNLNEPQRKLTRKEVKSKTKLWLTKGFFNRFAF